MTRHLTTWVSTIAAAALCLSLAACNQDGPQYRAASAEPSASIEAPPNIKPTPFPRPSDWGPRTFLPGEIVPMSQDNFSLQWVRSVDHVAGRPPKADLTPADGNEFWLVELLWTNPMDDPIHNMCEGPKTVEFKAFDSSGREMPLHPENSTIYGNDCDTELRVGRTAKYYLVFEAPKGYTLGWLELHSPASSTYESDFSAWIVMNPEIKDPGVK